ncbi:shikimate kinase [Candidatus Omnitrophota bacterium]
MKNIVLVGFMGTGKTRISKILAKRLKRQRLCIDDMIEWKIGKPISRIFTEDGEEYFRKLESEMAASVSKDRNAIIDAGGGIVINESNVRRLKEHGILFCLKARPEVIYDRVKAHAHRPLLNTEDPVSSIAKLLKERDNHYQRADYTIDTSDLKPIEIVDKIIAIVDEHESDKRSHLVLT